MDKIRSALGRHISSVQETMYVYIVQTFFLRHFDYGKKMFEMGMYPSVAQKSVSMEFFTVFQSAVHCVEQNFVGKEISVFNGFGNSGKLLINHATRSHIEMSDFAVSHLTVGKSYVHTRSAQLGVRIFFDKGVEILYSGSLYGVTVRGMIDTESVKYD